MKFEDVVKNSSVILAEGAVIERLNRQPAIELDPFTANTGLIACRGDAYNPREALSAEEAKTYSKDSK